VADFIDFLKYKSKKHDNRNTKRLSGKAKGLIKMKDDFDEPIEIFKYYITCPIHKWVWSKKPSNC
jgi:hypothetical protein